MTERRKEKKGGGDSRNSTEHIVHVHKCPLPHPTNMNAYLLVQYRIEKLMESASIPPQDRKNPVPFAHVGYSRYLS